MPVWKSTSASGAPDNSSLSHFSAMTWPRWLRRAVRNRHRHAIEQASRRWRGGRGDDSTRTLRKILISTQVEQQGLGHFEEAVVSAQNARRLARLCLSYSNRWLEAFENTHRTCAESLTLRGNQISGAPRHRRDIGSVAASARWRGVSRPSTRRCRRDRRTA